MRVLVCGSRHWTDADAIAAALRSVQPRPMLIIEGGAKGADSIAAALAVRARVNVAEYPADWTQHSKAAGPKRNELMLREGKPDLVLAFHEDPNLGKGTAHMVRIAREAGVPVRVFIRSADGRVTEAK